MKKLTINNWNELAPFMQQADYHEYNSNPMTLLMWSNHYEVHFETFAHFALCYTTMPGHDPVWLMPFCRASYCKEAMETLKKFSKTYSIPYGIHSMTKAFKNWLMQEYPLQFLIWNCYDARDYVYDRKQQESLAGKKMQKRRNHFHAFMAQYEGRYDYKELAKSDIPNIYAFLDEWSSQKEEDDSIDAERIGITLLLGNMASLPIRGGCIYIDGKLEAFNITSLLSNDTIQIHVEKANKQIRGLYIAILKLFLETLPDEVAYVNREDDMGLEELRKAKRDMHPIYNVQKFGSIHQPIEIHKATPVWDKAIRELWLTRFPEEHEDSTNTYFDHLYHMEDTYLLTNGDELISMIQLRKMNVMIDHQEKNACLIYGVATNSEYEHCGYMKILMNHVLSMTFEECDYIYIQAYQWEVYEQFGFDHEYTYARYKVNLKAYPDLGGSLQDTTDEAVLNMCYQTFIQDKNGYRVRNEDYYKNLYLPYAKLWNESIMMFSIDGNIRGYIRVQIKADGEWNVQECIYDSKDSLDKILGLLSKKAEKVFVSLPLDEIIEGRRKEDVCMKVKVKDNNNFPESHLFISESL